MVTGVMQICQSDRDLLFQGGVGRSIGIGERGRLSRRLFTASGCPSGLPRPEIRLPPAGTRAIPFCRRSTAIAKKLVTPSVPGMACCRMHTWIDPFGEAVWTGGRAAGCAGLSPHGKFNWDREHVDVRIKTHEWQKEDLT